MSTPDPKKLLIQAQLKSLMEKFDVDNPLADVKDALTKITTVLQNARGPSAISAENEARVLLMRAVVQTDPTAPEEMRSSLNEVDEVQALRVQLHEQLGHAIARACEVRAHVAMANATMSKLMKTVSAHVDGAIAREAAQADLAVGQKLRLQIHLPGMAMHEQSFDQKVVKVGKLPTSDVKLEHDDVSRMHAVIERTESENAKGFEWFVIDLGSAGGTIVNDRKVNKAKLKVGDVMIFGGATVRVV